jgi:hypothetical protein
VPARGSTAASGHERKTYRWEGETERRDRETGKAEWKPRSNRCEWTDVQLRVFP